MNSGSDLERGNGGAEAADKIKLKRGRDLLIKTNRTGKSKLEFLKTSISKH